MILCPNCDEGLACLSERASGNRLVCDRCGKIVERLEGVYYFHPEDAADFDQHSQEALAAIMDSETRHFWFVTRLEFVVSQLRRFVRRDAVFAEMGAGSAAIATVVASWCSDVSAVDIQTAGLLRAREKGIPKLYQMNLERSPFIEQFDAVGLFDVLEHFADESKVLSRLCTMLKPGGYLFVTVPAYSWLWNKRDELESHQRRYDRGQLGRALVRNGFKILESRYFFLSILPLLAMRSLRDRVFPSEVREGDHMRDVQLHRVVNTLLLFITRVENRLLRRFKLPVGGSLFVVARKSAES